MIFLTVGTHEPFDRLVRAVDTWCGSVDTPPEILGQITDRAAYTPRNFEAVNTLTPEDYAKHFASAQAIISHAGMGSIITALSHQTPIALLPRRGHLQETRNDHQYATVQHFRNRPGILVAEDETQIPDVMGRLVDTHVDTWPELSAYADPALIATLRSFIDAEPS